MQGGDNFYLRPDWEEALSKSAHKTTSPQTLIDHYFFSRLFQGWSELVRLVENVTSAPNDHPQRMINATIVWKDLNKHKTNFDKLREGILAKLHYNKQMPAWEDKDVLMQFDLSSKDSILIQRLLMYTSSSLVLNRLMHPIANIICINFVSQIDAEHGRLAELMWRYMHSRSPGLFVLLASPLALSLGSLADDAKHALTIIKELMIHGRPSEDGQGVETKYELL